MAVAVYILSGYCQLTAADFVRSKSNSSPLPLDPVDWVRDKYLEMQLDDVIRIELPETAADHRICTAARKFIAQRRTVAFVEQANSEKGVAPTARETAVELIRCCDELDEHMAHPGLRRSLAEEHPKIQTSRRRIRRWSQKFRADWGLGFGSLRSRDPMPEAQLVDKAGLRSCLVAFK